MPRSSLFWVIAALLFQAQAQTPAWAHPISQGAMNVVVFADHVEIEIRIPFEEIVIASTADKAAAAPNSLQAGLSAHGAYLLAHLHLKINGRDAAGSVVRWDEPEKSSGKFTGEHVRYFLRFMASEAGKPEKIDLAQDVLNEILYAPGNPWEATYVVNFSQSGGGHADQALLTNKSPAAFTCQWDGLSHEEQDGTWRTFKAFCVHGITHILTGYDHLLFIATLVLAAASFWDLFKVVGTFTIAHGITLTLSVLDIVRLPESVVEPMIAGSIIFVALENVFFPARSRNWSRLGAAFFFGLFHGLGFAGGLLEAMEGMPGTRIAVALIAFSVGVEIGHQVVVLPLYGALSLLRKSQKSAEARETFRARTRTYASAAISLAGVFYLAVALGWRPF